MTADTTVPRRVLAAILFIAGLVIPGQVIPGLGQGLAQAAPGWADGLEAGVTRARESGKPLFVVFRCVR